MCGDESLLTFDDYGIIASRRWELEIEASKTANRVLFCDTSAMSTQYFCFLYEGKFNSLVAEFSKLENYDLIIYLDSDVPWVDDGLRKNPDRVYTDSVFESVLADYLDEHPHTRVEKISGNYNERLTKAIQVVHNLLQQPIKLV